MKKNLFLTFILASLISIGYFNEEVLKVRLSREKLNAISLIQSDHDLIAVQTPGVKLNKKDRWMIEEIDYPASAESIDLMNQVLKGLQKLKLLNSDSEQQYFSNTKIEIHVKTNKENYSMVIGDVSVASGYFYIKIADKIYLCEDGSYLSETYSSEEELRLKKYIRLKNLFLQKSQFFIEKNPLYSLDIKKVEKVKIDSRRNRWYELDLVKNKATPKPFKGLKLLNLQKNVSSYLLGLKTQELHLGGQFILSDPLSDVFVTMKQEKLILKLYSALNGRYGKFMKIKGDLRIYELEAGSDALFHNDIQAFWNKKFFQENEFLNIKAIEFELKKQQGAFTQFIIPNVQDFKAESLEDDLEINSNMMNFIFNLMFNLADFSQPKYVNQLAWDNQLYAEFDQIQLRLLGRHFKVILANAEVVVIDKKLELSYHFNFNTEQFPPQILQSIFTAKKK